MTPPRICIANIGPAGRRARGALGAVALVATAAGLVAVAVLDPALPLRAALALPAFLGATGVLQAREKT